VACGTVENTSRALASHVPMAVPPSARNACIDAIAACRVEGSIRTIC
jgi:hypothetical protein